MYFVFGLTPNVKDFDLHHSLFRKFRYESSGKICSSLQKKFKEGIRTVYEQAKELYDEWERNFFTRNTQEPSIDDMDGEILKIYKQMTNAKSLIKQWQI